MAGHCRQREPSRWPRCGHPGATWHRHPVLGNAWLANAQRPERPSGPGRRFHPGGRHLGRNRRAPARSSHSVDRGWAAPPPATTKAATSLMECPQGNTTCWPTSTASLPKKPRPSRSDRESHPRSTSRWSWPPSSTRSVSPRVASRKRRSRPSKASSRSIPTIWRNRSLLLSARSWGTSPEVAFLNAVSALVHPRPTIRGFDGDRVLIMQDGVRTGSLSSQSGDHGELINAATLDRLEVVKAPRRCSTAAALWVASSTPSAATMPSTNIPTRACVDSSHLRPGLPTLWREPARALRRPRQVDDLGRRQRTAKR